MKGKFSTTVRCTLRLRRVLIDIALQGKLQKADEFMETLVRTELPTVAGLSINAYFISFESKRGPWNIMRLDSRGKVCNYNAVPIALRTARR